MPKSATARSSPAAAASLNDLSPRPVTSNIKATWHTLVASLRALGLPAGSVPAGSVPAGSVAIGSVPAGAVPAASVPAGADPASRAEVDALTEAAAAGRAERARSDGHACDAERRSESCGKQSPAPGHIVSPFSGLLRCVPGFPPGAGAPQEGTPSHRSQAVPYIGDGRAEPVARDCPRRGLRSASSATRCADSGSSRRSGLLVFGAVKGVGALTDGRRRPARSPPRPSRLARPPRVPGPPPSSTRRHQRPPRLRRRRHRPSRRRPAHRRRTTRRR